MTGPAHPPTLDEFLATSGAEVAAVAPRSMVYAPGGTRRSAVFHQIEPWSHEYAQWGWLETLKCVDLIYRHGVQNVFLPLYMSGHIREYDGDTVPMVQMVSRYLTNADMLNLFNRYGWRVRLVDYDEMPGLKTVARAFQDATPADAPKTLWLMTSAGVESQWNHLFRIMGRSAESDSTQTRQDAVLAMYGEAVPLVTLLLGFGKPSFNPELFPCLLQGEVQCYWSQQAGFGLTDRQFRTILYDYAYARPTWQKDKTTRAKYAASDRALWESEFILGLGRRVGPFWYPDMQGYPEEALP